MVECSLPTKEEWMWRTERSRRRTGGGGEEEDEGGARQVARYGDPCVTSLLLSKVD
jgi:hypothetical protein